MARKKEYNENEVVEKQCSYFGAMAMKQHPCKCLKKKWA
jgi:hypothetical protein